MNVLDRFLKYVSFPTASCEDSESVPSTERQTVLAHFIADELSSMGLSDVGVDGCGYVYAVLPATPGMENAEPIGFVSHMDTSPDAPGENIKAKKILYRGGDIDLGERVMRVSDFPVLSKYEGRELIVTDGSTLLGADDKAGVAEIVGMCEYFVTHPEAAHRTVYICFTPDEEIGRGADHFDYDRFGAKVAYTVDGGELGEIEYENFNAAAAVVKVHGVNIHPGSAKNKMKNAALLAAEFINRLPAADTPAHTEGYEGFYHVSDICANETEAVISMIIRDHDREKFEKRKAFVKNLCEYLNGVYGDGTFEAFVSDSYYNMKEKIAPHMELIERAKEAMKQAGAEPLIVPIRGGTDGARLSWEGNVPCPNLSTGGVNFHSVYEFIPADALDTMRDVLVNLAQ